MPDINWAWAISDINGLISGILHGQLIFDIRHAPLTEIVLQLHHIYFRICICYLFMDFPDAEPRVPFGKVEVITSKILRSPT
jgi:hypothetical protein